jgi:hypothetical protein
MNRLKFLLFISIAGIVSGCWPDDDPIPAQPVEVIPYTFYTHQVYFNLQHDSVVSYNLLSDWDLGFDCSPNGYRIILNTGKGLAALKTNNTNIKTEVGIVDASLWQFDASSGNADSLAIAGWVDTAQTPFTYTNQVFLLGISDGVSYSAVKKMQFIGVDASSFTMVVADLDNLKIDTILVNKDNRLNFVKASVIGPFEVKPIEPEKTNWDLVFTQYATILFDDDGTPVPYLVRGVLINPYKTLVAKLDLADKYDYYRLDTSQFQELSFQNYADVIGYDWKDVLIDENANSAVYTANPKRVYLVKTQHNELYKLRFLSFYNSQGLPGYIGYEMQKISNQ